MPLTAARSARPVSSKLLWQSRTRLLGSPLSQPDACPRERYAHLADKHCSAEIDPMNPNQPMIVVDHNAIGSRLCASIVAALAACFTSCGFTGGGKLIERVDYPAGIHEDRVEIVGRPEFRQSEDFCELTIDGLDTGRFRYLSWPRTAPNPKGLDVTSPWRFELLRQDGGKWNCVAQEVLTASSQGQVIFDASLCEVHHLKMSRVVEVCDDYADRTKPDGFGFYEVRSRQFPHSGTAFPFCTFYPNRELTWKCAECTRASKRWCHRYLKGRPLM